MWWTQVGERVLKGLERTLFQQGLNRLWDDLNVFHQSDVEHYGGVVAFDDLTFEQKLAMLVDIGEALFDEAVPRPELTAVNEAAVAAVFTQIECEVVLESESGPQDTGWRSMVLAACRQCEILPEELSEPASDDMAQWELLIRCLQDRILWDADYEDLRRLDDPPELRKVMGNWLGISETYYEAVARDPAPAELKELRKRLKAVLAG